MPDLTNVLFAYCVSRDTFSREVEGANGRKYTVTYTQTIEGPYQYGFECTCLAFKYKKTLECKHIKSVKDQFCGESQIDSSHTTCPNCGSEVKYEYWGI